MMKEEAFIRLVIQDVYLHMFKEWPCPGWSFFDEILKKLLAQILSFNKPNGWLLPQDTEEAQDWTGSCQTEDSSCASEVENRKSLNV